MKIKIRFFIIDISSKQEMQIFFCISNDTAKLNKRKTDLRITYE